MSPWGCDGRTGAQGSRRCGRGEARPRAGASDRARVEAVCGVCERSLLLAVPHVDARGGRRQWRAQSRRALARSREGRTGRVSGLPASAATAPLSPVQKSCRQ